MSTNEDGTLLILGMDWEIFLIKAMFFCGVTIAAFAVQHIGVKALRKVLDSFERAPSASIFLNGFRIAVWVVALLIVLEPVFGVRPTAFLTALGVSSIIISLGLKDTISNIFGGLMLMVGRVVRPGDYVTVAGIKGTVVDVTMRHTVVENRLDERIVVPNSVLNTTSIVVLPASSESMGTIEFTMELGSDPHAVAADIVAEVTKAGGDDLRPDMPPKVFFDSITPYGVKGQIFYYVNEGIPFARVRDRMVRSIAEKDYFSLKGARALSEE